MSHRWGFDLSASAVRLMRREAGHWREIASEPFEGEDMDDRFRRLAEKVPEPRNVDVFLPRDQILYTEVEVPDPESAVRTVETAMEGRTPYALAELEIDWELGPDGTAAIAAIARETLAEAEAFADQCGLSVLRFSALADPSDFPRLPDFGLGAKALEDASDGDAGSAPAFASGRAIDPPATTEPGTDDAAPSRDTAPRDESAPVVQVDDAAPVMQVVNEREAPLDPGPALPRVAGAPRVRTDLSLGEGGGQAARSLTPPEPVDPYGRSEPPLSNRMRSIGLGLALILTAGIALIVWSILPQSADTGDTARTAPTETAIADAPPALSDTPPDVLAEGAPQPPLPDEIAPGALSPADDAAPRTVLPTALAQATPLGQDEASVPGPDSRAGTPRIAIPQTDALASLAPVAEDPGTTPTVGQPPVTRPGNVALPPVQAFDAGVPPVAGTAPDYVPPEAVAVADAAPDEVPPEALAAAEATPDETTPETPLPGGQLEESTDTAALAPAEETPDALPDETDLVTAETATEDSDLAATDPDAAAAPVTADAEPVASLPEPTELAAALTDIRARPRPSNFTLEIERQIFGGRTRTELSRIRPPDRPESAQLLAEAARENTPPSALAVAVSPDPRGRPSDIGDIVAQALAVQRERQLAAVPTTDTTSAVRAALDIEVEDDEAEAEAATNARNAPRLAIPSNADVARQATVEDAIRLNRLNLVGVFGAPSDRRALIRLPSGRYVKVRIGDSVDGGTIAAITDSALQYRKGGRTYQLTMPQG